MEFEEYFQGTVSSAAQFEEYHGEIVEGVRVGNA